MKNIYTKAVRTLTLLFLIISITACTLPVAAAAAGSFGSSGGVTPVSAPSAAGTPAGSAVTAPAAATQNPSSFKPLTNLPGLTSDSNAYAGDSSTLPGFLSKLYKICIGAAAVFAVIQIMRAGFKGITSNESVLAKSEARDMIQNAVLGLILVLSPYVIFSIINKDILNLDFTKDFASLQSKELTHKNVEMPIEPALTSAQTNQKTDQRIDSHRCTNSSIHDTISKNLLAARKTQQKGTLFVNIQQWGQDGLGCCEATIDTNGAACKPGFSDSIGFGEFVPKTQYTCSCG